MINLNNEIFANLQFDLTDINWKDACIINVQEGLPLASKAVETPSNSQPKSLDEVEVISGSKANQFKKGNIMTIIP